MKQVLQIDRTIEGRLYIICRRYVIVHDVSIFATKQGESKKGQVMELEIGKIMYLS